MLQHCFPPQAQDFALALAELCNISVSAFLQPDQVLLIGNPTTCFKKIQSKDIHQQFWHRRRDFSTVTKTELPAELQMQNPFSISQLKNVVSFGSPRTVPLKPVSNLNNLLAEVHHVLTSL